MKGHKLFNKAIAGALTLALALGIAPAAVGVGIEAYADTATPSVSAHATKAQLADDTFKPNAWTSQPSSSQISNTETRAHPSEIYIV